MNFYDLRSAIDGTIIQLNELRKELELDNLCKEKGLSEVDRTDVEKVLKLMDEADALHKLHKKMKSTATQTIKM